MDEIHRRNCREMPNGLSLPLALSPIRDTHPEGSSYISSPPRLFRLLPTGAVCWV